MFVGQGLAQAGPRIGIVADLKWISRAGVYPSIVAMIGTLKAGQTYVFPYEGQTVFTVPGSRAGA